MLSELRRKSRKDTDQTIVARELSKLVPFLIVIAQLLLVSRFDPRRRRLALICSDGRNSAEVSRFTTIAHCLVLL